MYIYIYTVKIICYTGCCTNGSEYYLGFIPQFQTPPIVILVTTERSPVYYSIEAPGADYYLNGTIIPNTQNRIKLPQNLTGKSHTFPNKKFDKIPKGFRIKTSSDKVTVIGQSGVRFTTDTFLAIPVKELCLHEYVYYIFSVSGGSNADTSVAIVGTEDNTTMNITATVDSYINLKTGWSSLPSNTKHSYVINKLQTVYMATYLQDFTGSKIVADKPLSVITGHECAFVDSSGCDHLLEQVLPTALWGSTYYIAPIASAAYTIKIIAAQDSTALNVTCNGTQSDYQMVEGGILQGSFYNQYCAIHSNKEISVALISHGSAIGDPMMVLIPAVIDYSNKIVSSTNSHLEFPGYKHYINIIVMAEYFQKDLIYLNAEGINQTLASYNWVPIVVDGITEAYAAQIKLNIDDEMFQIIHSNQSALMSAIVYGFNLQNDTTNSNRKVGYGHPAGLSILKRYPSMYTQLSLY